MQIGLTLPQLGGHVTRDGLRGFCEQAEELGFGSLWVQEHLFYVPHPVSGYSARPGLKVPDAYRSVLGAARDAHRRRGMDDAAGGRHQHPGRRAAPPGALAQQFATIDLISEGRVIAGFSVGWSDEEHQVMDVDPRTRGARCDELIDALVACWGPDPVAFAGRFFSIPESDVQPKPLQLPRPRLLSGMRSPAGLRRTAEKFDIWNPASGTLEQHLEMFGDCCSECGRRQLPLELYRRLFTVPPVEVANLRPRGLTTCAPRSRAPARRAWSTTVMVDTNFDPALDSAPRLGRGTRTLAPLLDAAG